MDNLLKIRKKIFRDCESFEPHLKSWKGKGNTIVFTNGCFDLLHRGHVEYLARAADKGDKLVIGLNSDLSVTRLKGKNRPVVDELSRALMLAAFQFVAAVILFEDDTPLKTIEKIHPDFLIKGNDYALNEIAGHELVMAYGGKVETIELVPELSTSLLIEKIKKHDKS
jgi:D-glycero-beta-D-manno-heptose 1-phosphate adenylyltransferase